MSESNVNFDKNGFLKQPEVWSWELAQQIADQHGLGELRDEHKKVIDYLRNHYLENRTIPVMRHVCSENGLDDHCVSDLMRDPEMAWRIAGLPDPGEEAMAYLQASEIQH